MHNGHGSTWNAFGGRVRELRRNRKLGLRELGRIAGVSYAFLSEIERGGRRASEDTIGKLAKVLNVSAKSLVRLAAQDRISDLRQQIQELEAVAR